MIDQHVLQLATSQLGVISRKQLVELGKSTSAIDRALGTGRLQPLLPATYLIEPVPLTFEVRCRAVEVWSDGVGFVSGVTAGRLRGLSRMPAAPIEFTVPHTFRRAAPTGIQLLRTSWYDRDADREPFDDGTMIATAERMVFGIAASIGTARHPRVERQRQRRFDDAADDAWNLGLTTPRTMSHYLERHRCRGKDGVGRVEAWVERALCRELPSQSYFERDLINALVDVGLPEPVRQHRLALHRHHPIKLDIAWPDIRLAVEPGHSRFHAGASAIERDSRRDLACAEAGWEIIRLTESARDDLPGTARRIAAIHRHRSQLVHTA